jgi:SH3-like domain-containing protein
MKIIQGKYILIVAGFMFAVYSIFSPLSAKTWRIKAHGISALNLRKSPSSRSKVIIHIPAGTKGLKGGKCKRGWCSLRYKGKKGWVYRRYLLRDEKIIKTKASQKTKKTDRKSVSLKKSKTALKPTSPKTSAPPEKLKTTVPKSKSSQQSSKHSTEEEYPDLLRLASSNSVRVIYDFPDKRLPIAGRIASHAKYVERIGPCTQNWCHVRSGSLTGWLHVEALAPLPDASNTKIQKARVSKTLVQKDKAKQKAARKGPEPGHKLYALAGLEGRTSLPIREHPKDGASILAFIPGTAKDVEGLRKCSGKWCLIRYRDRKGWVERRHLADESIGRERMYRLVDSAMWNGLEIFDAPKTNASAVGHIPAYATGIVPIGRCEETWCHVRYLGLAGWVKMQYLAPHTSR